MNLPSLSELVAMMTPDPWRDQVPFASEMQQPLNDLFTPEPSKQENCLNQWIAGHQSCLFGRLAAKANAITFCIINENDLVNGDDHVKRLVQNKRLEWRQKGCRGKSSAFVIAVISPKIARCRPDSALLSFAQRLCALYLLEDQIETDKVYMDELFLESEPNKSAWRWNAGVNFFSSQGDGRWWRDHRFPGGMAFSVNSVGHLVKSNKESEEMIKFCLENGIGNLNEHKAGNRVNSLSVAHEFAMRTIANAASGSSGKATWLKDLPQGETFANLCPFKAPAGLSTKNPQEYGAFYHTDITIPSAYFSDEANRQESVKELALDFTYLFRNDVNNPSYDTTGEGLQIKLPDPSHRKSRPGSIAKMTGELVSWELVEPHL